jgi:hypothetical protein
MKVLPNEKIKEETPYTVLHLHFLAVGTKFETCSFKNILLKKMRKSVDERKTFISV